MNASRGLLGLLMLAAGCASSPNSMPAPVSCPRLPTVPDDEPIYMHFPWSGWLHQRGDHAESMPLGDFETLDECRAAALATARGNRDLVNARAATLPAFSPMGPPSGETFSLMGPPDFQGHGTTPAGG